MQYRTMRLHILALTLFLLLGTAPCASDASPKPASVFQKACSAGNATFTKGLVRGGRGDDIVLGGVGEVHGDEDNDRIYGGRKSIRAFGDEGQDLLDGSPMADDIAGGPGQDILIGELGADRFVYEQVRDSPADPHGRWSVRQGDTIVDFSTKDGDEIDLSKLPVGDPRAGRRLRWSNTSHRPYGVWVSPREGDTVVFVETTGDRRADLAIRLLGRVRLSPTDFCGAEPR